MSWVAWGVPLLAGLVAAVVIQLRLRFAGAGLDMPGHRSLHERPTPHGGGLGVVAAMLVAGPLVGVPWYWLAGIVVLAGMSWVDDWFHLPFWLRLPVHVLVAAGVVFLHSEANAWQAWLAVWLIAWTINAYNFMDGADGLAGSMASVGFAAYAFAFALDHKFSWAIFCFAVVVAALVFLCFNWHPARIFMGDGGSIPLGFLAGGLGWWGVQEQVWPLWFPLMVFAPFWLDATVTLLRRLCRGERVWEAHREHYYQRMVRGGLSHAQMSGRWLAVMLTGSALALCALRWPQAQTGVVVLWGLVLLALAMWIDRQWNNKNQVVDK